MECEAVGPVSAVMRQCEKEERVLGRRPNRDGDSTIRRWDAECGNGKGERVRRPSRSGVGMRFYF